MVWHNRTALLLNWDTARYRSMASYLVPSWHVQVDVASIDPPGLLVQPLFSLEMLVPPRSKACESLTRWKWWENMVESCEDRSMGYLLTRCHC